MNKPFTVFVQHRHPLNAVNWYRILQPLKILEDQKKVSILEDHLDPALPDQDRNDMIGAADICFTHAVPAMILFRDYRGMEDLPPRYNGVERIVDYSAPWVMDIDDVYDWVSPTNPAFVTWGVRDMSGEMLGDGGKIVATLQDGRQEILFEDGHRVAEGRGYNKNTIFSYRSNLHRLAKLKTAVRSISCITTTTEALKAHIEAEDHPRRIEVFPNCMWRKQFPDIVAKDSKRVRILWQGGGSHYDDWVGVRDAMAEVTKRYPEIMWVIWGQDYTPLMRGGGITDENIEYHPWVDFQAHKYELALLGCDINLAVIEPNHFSKGKSSLKFYEASALKKPICTLATRADPYDKDVQEEKTGLMYLGPEEFVSQLGRLIENPKLRRELAANAHDWVWENRDAEKWAEKLLEMFQEMKETHIKVQGDVREMFGVEEGNLVSNNIPVREEEGSAILI